MNPAKDNTNSSINQNPQIIAASVSHGKEREPFSTGAEVVQEVSNEIEIPEEVEKAGMNKFHEKVEIPPDLKKLGVSQSGSSIPISQSASIPAVSIPISDAQVLAGLHSTVAESLKWIATWSIKKLKKAHIALKIIHGKIVRVLIR